MASLLSLPQVELAIAYTLHNRNAVVQAEEAVKAQGFARVSIFRPGTLDRGQNARWNERLASRLLTTTPVKDVARAMVLDAETSRTGVHVYEEASIIDAVKSGTLP